MAFTCPRCGAVSHHPKDEEEGYCGRCHDWTAPPASGPVASQLTNPPRDTSLSDVPLLAQRLERLEEAENAILADLPRRVREVFDLGRGVAMVCASMHEVHQARRLEEFQSIVATLQVCADNLRLGVVLLIETRQ